MGYTSRAPLTFFELSNTLQLNSDIVDTTDRTIAFGAFYVPTYLKNYIRYAYLDAYVPYWNNNFAGENSLDDSSGTSWVQIKSFTGGTWTNAIGMGVQTMSSPASTLQSIGRIIGHTDIASEVITCINQPTFHLLNVQWIHAKAYQNSFTCRNMHFGIRLIG